jgi:hypothetical protein
MAEILKDGLLVGGSAKSEEEILQESAPVKPEPVPLKTVMVYWMDQNSTRKEPIAILAERRKSERDNNNAIGMLRLARKVFAKTEEEAKRIIIGDYV